MDLTRSFPVLLVDDEVQDDTAAGRMTRALVDLLRGDGTPVITAATMADAEQIVESTANLSGLLIDWDAHHPQDPPPGAGGAATLTASRARTLIETLRARNPTLPVFILADRSAVNSVPPGLLATVDGWIWKLEDTPVFVASDDRALPAGDTVIMPGERFPAQDGPLLGYLAASESLSRRFPGFETEIHGLQIDGSGAYRAPCLPGDG